MRIVRCAAAVVALTALSTSVAAAAARSPDPGAVAAVTQYVQALQISDTDRAFRLLTPAQQRYFGNARNYASNYAAASYSIVGFSIARTVMRTADLAEIDVAQTTSYNDIAADRTVTAKSVEPYFALRAHGAWGVKEIYQPWKSYAPNASGNGGGLTVVVNRVEFFDRRLQVVCTLRNLGARPLQVLPLLKSRLTIGASSVAAMNSATFPLNDQQMFEGARIYPFHQLVGYLNFPLASRRDMDLKATLVIAPVVQDGARAPGTVTIGPIYLRKL